MKVQKVERHNICRGHPMWKACDEICFKSKNLYNYANYTLRNQFSNNEKLYSYIDMCKLLKTETAFKEIGSNSGQHVLKMLDKNWKSFFVAIKDYYSKNVTKYLGEPKPPKYLKKNGRYVVVLTNWQSQIKDGYLYFAFTRLKPYNNMFKTKVKDKHLCTRIKPNGNSYILEIVYQQEIDIPQLENNHIASIDLGVNNLITLTNNIGVKPIIINGKKLKADNQFYNKQKHKFINMKANNKMARLSNKRYFKMEYSMHMISRYVVDWCIRYDIDTLVIGHNNKWKQSCRIGNATQEFVYIPYENLIHKIKYKCENVGIKVIETEEGYTSGTSFLDGECPVKEKYNKSRRIKRGLFKANNGQLINSDVNGSLQIMKKVFPNAFADGIEGLDLVPIVVNLL